MMRLLAVMTMLASCLTAQAADPASAPPLAPPTAAPAGVYRPEEWAGPVDKAGQQFELLQLLAKASHFGGITVKIPGELQRVPLGPLGLQELEDRGIELYVKEFTFRNLEFSRDEKPLWMGTRPVLPALMRFSTLGASIEANTKAGMIPLGATFHNGVLPFDFDFRKDGYDLGLIPERRAAEAKIDGVRLHVGGPIMTGIVNAFFTDDVARLVLKYGVGQTLKMNEIDLFSGATAASFLKMRSDSIGAQAVSGLIDAAAGK
jgi:hypothetical protein